jgi:hypothetical protein
MPGKASRDRNLPGFYPSVEPRLGGAGSSRTSHPLRDRNPSCTFAVLAATCTAFPVKQEQATAVPATQAANKFL